jgi:hypothetical protein
MPLGGGAPRDVLDVEKIILSLCVLGVLCVQQR